jgi:hypothetical protein
MAITTALDLIKKALKQLRVLGVGDTLSDVEAQDSLDTLNLMLESWSLDRLFVYQETQRAFSTVNGQASYTVGPGAQFDMPTRPLKLTSAFTRSQGIDYQMSILTDATQYDGLVNKLIVTSFPNYIWYEQTYPLGTIYFFPVPSGNPVYLRFWDQVQAFPDLTTQITLPIGYKECMAYNLAVSLAGEFGLEPPPTVGLKAANSLTRLKRYNIKAQFMTSEPSYMGRWNNRYNIMSDSFD